MTLLPKVTILLPTYNQDAFILEAAESALSQSYSNIEVIVLDDCSTDSTSRKVEGLKKYPNFYYHRNKRNIGRVANYRKGLYEVANGDWVLILDGDDYLTDVNFIKDAIDLLGQKENKNVVFIQAGHVIVFQDNLSSISCLPKIPEKSLLINGMDYFMCLDRTDHFSHLSTLYKREVALTLNFYCQDILSADMESIVRLSLHGDVILLQRAVGVWRQHANNASLNLNYMVYVDNLKWIDSCYDYATKFVTDSSFLSKTDKWKRRMTDLFLSKYLSVGSLLFSPVRRKLVREFVFYLWRTKKRHFSELEVYN